MFERIMSVTASLSEEQARQLKAFLLSRRPFTKEAADELNHILDGSEQAKRPRITTCEQCSCFTQFVTCSEMVWNGTKFVPVVTYLKECGFWERVNGCLGRLLTFGFLRR